MRKRKEEGRRKKDWGNFGGGLICGAENLQTNLAART